MSKLLLLDGNSLTYRAFFALPPDMATASGQVTNAVFGFTSMLINLLRDNRPDGVIAAFDRPEPTFRHEAIADYKANRTAAPDILRQQMGLVRQVVETLGIVTLDVAGFEADDIIATVVEEAKAKDVEVIIVTGDRDEYQLVEDPLVKVLYNRRGVSDYALYDEAGIFERTGVTPKQYPEYAAMRGDPSDNLPGVPGVGEKTAAKLIATYGGLDGIFANLQALTPKLRASLAEHEERVRQNAAVMVLRRDAPVTVELESLTWGPSDMAELKRLFDFLEFRTLFERLEEVLNAPITAGPVDGGQVIEAEVVRFPSAADAVVALGQPVTLDVAAAWVGAPGRSAVAGLAVVLDPESAEVGWLPASYLGGGEGGAQTKEGGGRGGWAGARVRGGQGRRSRRPWRGGGRTGGGDRAGPGRGAAGRGGGGEGGPGGGEREARGGGRGGRGGAAGAWGGAAGGRGGGGGGRGGEGTGASGRGEGGGRGGEGGGLGVGDGGGGCGGGGGGRWGGGGWYRRRGRGGGWGGVGGGGEADQDRLLDDVSSVEGGGRSGGS